MHTEQARLNGVINVIDRKL